MSEYEGNATDRGEPAGRKFFSFFHRRKQPSNLRNSIAALVQQAANEADSAQNGEQPELDRQERALIANVLRLRNISADDVMVPRADIVAMPVSISLDEALAMMRRENHSRMPVYRDQLDDIVGMIHVKDLIAYVAPARRSALKPCCASPCLLPRNCPCWTCCCRCASARRTWPLLLTNMAALTVW